MDAGGQIGYQAEAGGQPYPEAQAAVAVRNLHIYQTPQGKNQRICAAFAAGSGGKIVAPYPLMPGDVFMFGALRGLLPTLRRAQREGRRWFYGDNGYFRTERSNPGAGYFRVTRNAMQHDGAGEASPERWRKLKLNIAPWRTKGSHIVVCPPAGCTP